MHLKLPSEFKCQYFGHFLLLFYKVKGEILYCLGKWLPLSIEWGRDYCGGMSVFLSVMNK